MLACVGSYIGILLGNLGYISWSNAQTVFLWLAFWVSFLECQKVVLLVSCKIFHCVPHPTDYLIIFISSTYYQYSTSLHDIGTLKQLNSGRVRNVKQTQNGSFEALCLFYFCEFWPQYYSWLLSGLRAYKMDQDIQAPLSGSLIKWIRIFMHYCFLITVLTVISY